MNQPHNVTTRWTSMRWFASIVAMLVVAMLGLAAAPAYADNVFPTLGGTGGGETTDRCDNGTYLIGVRVKSGDWIDQISLICAEIHLNTSAGNNTPFSANVKVMPRQFGGTGGGAPVNQECAQGEHIESLGVVPTTTRSVDVRTMEFGCVSFDNKKHTLVAGNPASTFDYHNFQPCIAGQAATGLHIRWGAYLDAVGLICDRFLPIKTTGEPTATTANPPGGAGPSISPNAPLLYRPIFDTQNTYRQACGTPKMLWQKQLEQRAQNWALGCHKKIDPTTNKEVFCHENDSKCPGNNAADTTLPGENLAWGPGEAGGPAATSWICERKNYSPSNPQWAGGTVTSTQNDPCPGPTSGHFTQVVWAASTFVGCGYGVCTLNGQQETLWDCKYEKPGNWNVDTSFPGVTVAIAQQNFSANVSKTCPCPPGLTCPQ